MVVRLFLARVPFLRAWFLACVGLRMLFLLINKAPITPFTNNASTAAMAGIIQGERCP